MPRWKLRGNSVYDCGDLLPTAFNGSDAMRCWYILRVEPKWDCLVLAVHGGAWFVLYCWLNEQCRCYMPFRIILQVRRASPLAVPLVRVTLTPPPPLPLPSQWQLGAPRRMRRPRIHLPDWLLQRNSQPLRRG